MPESQTPASDRIAALDRQLVLLVAERARLFRDAITASQPDRARPRVQGADILHSRQLMHRALDCAAEQNLCAGDASVIMVSVDALCWNSVRRMR